MIDNALIRRGQPAANVVWGNQRSVLAGDWLYMQAFKVALQERNFRVLDVLIDLNRQIQERMDRGETFSFAYADLSDFKPFNDKYGFSRGDEVLKITGRLLFNIVKSRQPRGSFIGHIGGDDFVFIMEPELIEAACTDIIRAFDQIIPTFYDPEDREKRGIESVDRRGVARFFSFIGLSIGVTGTGIRRFSHFGELTGAVSEMKRYAKKIKGSSFSVDNRKDPPA